MSTGTPCSAITRRQRSSCIAWWHSMWPRTTKLGRLWHAVSCCMHLRMYIHTYSMVQHVITQSTCVCIWMYAVASKPAYNGLCISSHFCTSLASIALSALCAQEFILYSTVLMYVLPLQNTPDDLQLLSDAPAHHLFVLLPPVTKDQTTLPDVLCVLQVQRTTYVHRLEWRYLYCMHWYTVWNGCVSYHLSLLLVVVINGQFYLKFTALFLLLF